MYRAKTVNGIPTPLLITGSPTTLHIETSHKIPAQIRFHSNRPHTITQMNDDIHMDSTIAGSVTVRS
jgi:hypothetical protein